MATTALEYLPAPQLAHAPGPLSLLHTRSARPTVCPGVAHVAAAVTATVASCRHVIVRVHGARQRVRAGPAKLARRSFTYTRVYIIHGVHAAASDIGLTTETLSVAFNTDTQTHATDTQTHALREHNPKAAPNHATKVCKRAKDRHDIRG